MYNCDKVLKTLKKISKTQFRSYSTKPPYQTRHWVRMPTADVHDFLEMPSPRSLPLIGTLLSLLAAGGAPNLHKYIDARHRDLGTVFREAIGPVDAVFVSDPLEMRSVFNQEGKYPKHVLPEAWLLYNKIFERKRGLFFMNDEEWLHFRRIMNKYLLKAENSQYLTSPCEVSALQLVERWKSLFKNKEKTVIPNLEGELYRNSIDTIVAVLLGDEYKNCIDILDPEITKLASVVNLIFKTSSKLSLMPANLASKLKLPAWTKFVKAADDGLFLANKLMKTILKECPKGNGLLSKMQQENMDQNDINRIFADLILAAGDTTAYSMQWTLYLLSSHEKIQENLFQDIDNSSLLKGIIREALRLYPVAPFLTRILPENINLGGYLVPKNTLIIMSLYTSSRDPKYFINPDEFCPDRWSRQNGNYLAANPYASLPFAMGARSCIGKKIADTQMATTIKQLTKNFKMELNNNTKVDMILRLVSVPSVPIRLEISCRS